MCSAPGHLIHLPSPKPRVSRIRPVKNPRNQQEDRDVEAEWYLEEKKLSCEQSKPTQRIHQCLTTNPPPPASMPRLGWGLKINGWNGWMDGPGKSRAWSLAVLASRPASSETASGARPGAARFGMYSAENMNKCLPVEYPRKCGRKEVNLESAERQDTYRSRRHQIERKLRGVQVGCW